MKINLTSSGKSERNSTSKRGGFTLVEILVAVGIMALLLAIILVPLRLGFETYHIGTARSALQQEVQLTMQQMSKDFGRANFVFPNSRIPGISDSNDSTSACSLAPYAPNGRTTGTGIDPAWQHLPYFKSTLASATGDTAAPGFGGITSPISSLKAIANPSRIDMLFLRRSLITAAPTPIANFTPETGEDYVVSYYPRRVDISKVYDVIDNPIVLFRAQYPYRYYRESGTTAAFTEFPSTTSPSTAFNAQVDWTRYPSLGASSVDTNVNRSFLWITHNYYGEANLEPLTQDAATTPAATVLIPRSHALAIPRGMQLIAPKANSTSEPSFIPELSFVQSSSNNQRIDRVTVSMTLAQYDQTGAASVNGQGKAQRVPVTQTFDLPNASCSK